MPKKSWRASKKQVPVYCPVKDCDVKGTAAENAVTEDTPLAFRAACPEHGTALKVGKRK